MLFLSWISIKKYRSDAVECFSPELSVPVVENSFTTIPNLAPYRHVCQRDLLIVLQFVLRGEGDSFSGVAPQTCSTDRTGQIIAGHALVPGIATVVNYSGRVVVFAAPVRVHPYKSAWKF